MREKGKVFIFTVLIVGIFAMTSCGGADVKFDEEKEKADQVVKDVKWDMYFHEEAEEIKAIARKAKEKIKEAGKKVDIGKIKKAIKEFKDEVKKIPTRDAYIETYINALKKNFTSLKEENKAKAENILKSFEEKLKKSKTKNELDKIGKEVVDKVKAETGEEVRKVDNALVNDEVKREVESIGASTGVAGANDDSLKSKASSEKASSTRTKAETKPTEKKRVWVVDKPAWTETKTYPNYATREIWWVHYNNGTEKTFYSEKEAFHEYEGNPNVGSWGNSIENYIKDYYTETIEHPEEGHWEYR